MSGLYKWAGHHTLFLYIYFFKAIQPLAILLKKSKLLKNKVEQKESVLLIILIIKNNNINNICETARVFNILYIIL